MRISSQIIERILEGDLEFEDFLQDYDKLKYRIGNMSRNKTKGKSRFKGVDFQSHNKKWRARITKNYSKIFLGYFNTEIEAARKYDNIALEIFGKYARLNREIFPDKF